MKRKRCGTLRLGDWGDNLAGGGAARQTGGPRPWAHPCSVDQPESTSQSVRL